MKNKQIATDWLKHASSNLARARHGKTSEEVLYEDLCFDCQQCAEKSIKAVMAFYTIEVIQTHSLPLLIHSLEDNNIIVPEPVKDAMGLTDYAVQTRYPGFYEPVTVQEYNDALKQCKAVYDWATKVIH